MTTATDVSARSIPDALTAARGVSEIFKNKLTTAPEVTQLHKKC